MGYVSKVSAACLLLLVLLSWAAAPAGAAAVAFPSISLQKVASGFDEPTDIAVPRDGSGRLFILEKKGLVRIVKAGKLLPIPFLDIRRLAKILRIGTGTPGRSSEGFVHIYWAGRRGVGSERRAIATSGHPSHVDDVATACPFAKIS